MRAINYIRILSVYYSMDSNIENIDHQSLQDVLDGDLNSEFISFEDLYEAINEQKIKESIFKTRQIKTKEKTISFVYLNIMKVLDNDQIQGVPISKNFLTNVKFNTKANLHHSHITGEIYGYTHGFCNRKVREIRAR